MKSKAPPTEALWGDLDFWIRNAQSVRARAVARKLYEDLGRARSITPELRRDRLRLASILRRVGEYSLAVNLLFPMIYASGRRPVQASAEEKIEYAASLNELGAPRESLRLLRQVDVARYPRALLFQAFCFFSDRDYEKASEILKKYLQVKTLTPYERLIGVVNIVASEVRAFSTTPLEPWFEEGFRLAKSEKAGLLLGNLYELQAQSLILKRKFDAADEVLRLAIENAAESTGFDRLYLEFTSALLRLYRDGDSSPLQLVRDLAREKRNPEVIRDSDFHEGLARNDSENVRKIYYGTFSVPYRNRISRLMPTAIEFDKASTVSAKIDSRVGAKKVPLKKGSILQKLFQLLMMERYRAFRPLEIFDSIYDRGESHPDSAAQSVRQAVKRLRRYLERNLPGFEVHTTDEGYSLYLPESAKVDWSWEEGMLTRASTLSFPAGEFTAIQFARLKKLPIRTAQRHLNEAVKAGRLVTKGAARSRVYRRLDTAK